MQGGYLAIHACEGQKASQSTLKAYQDGSLHQGGLLDILQMPFALLRKQVTLDNRAGGRRETLEFGSCLCVLV